MSEDSIGIGVLGLGFMGRTHVRAWNAATQDGHACHLAAVSDARPEALTGEDQASGNIEASAGERLFDPGVVHCHTEPEALFADESVQIVSICTPTDSHVELCLRALEAGKHVLIEKPLALTAEACEPVARAAASASTLCMPAFCMRFWPGWDWLAREAKAGSFGAVQSASFRRLASPPAWNPDFYRDPTKTGGALVDLHIHDTDFVRFAFGEPDSVQSTGTLDHVTTHYQYANGPTHVAAEGAWDHHPGFPFEMRYVVVFEEATADFQFGREQPLLVHKGGESQAIPLADHLGYDGEVRHLLAAVRGECELAATAEDALATARLLDLERSSLMAASAPVTG